MELTDMELSMMADLMTRAVKHEQMILSVEERGEDGIFDAISLCSNTFEVSEVSSENGEIIELAMTVDDYRNLAPDWRS